MFVFSTFGEGQWHMAFGNVLFHLVGDHVLY